MLTRRDYLKYTGMAGATCALPGGFIVGQDHGPIIKRAIPKSGEEIPVVGLGSSATFQTAVSYTHLTLPTTPYV